MTTHADRFFIVTGGPGSGKTTLLAALARAGIPHMPEAGRAIIQDQLAIGGDALPWGDRRAFAELMLGWDLRSWREAERHAGPVLFDRGIPDVIGYLMLCGLEPPAHLLRAADTRRYDRRVFIAPPWPGIYGQDTERKQSFAEARATHDAVAAAYAERGYELVPLPLASIDERARFVLERIDRTISR